MSGAPALSQSELRLSAMSETRGSTKLFYPGPWQRAYVMQPDDDARLHRALKDMLKWRLVLVLAMMVAMVAGIFLYMRLSHAQTVPQSVISIAIVFVIIRYCFTPFVLNLKMRGRPRTEDRRGLLQCWRAEGAVFPARSNNRLLYYVALLVWVAFARWETTPHTFFMLIRTGLYVALIAYFAAKFFVVRQTQQSSRH